MPVSKPCDHCGLVKRCSLYLGRHNEEPTTENMTYLCRVCARELEYEE